MLCMQQCIDLCDFSPEEAETIRTGHSLPEILAVQAECPHIKAAVSGRLVDPEAVARCSMLDIRDQLLEELWAADEFAELQRVVIRYRAYAIAQAAEGGGADLAD
ncbi:MAG: hypothetical protein OEL88_13065 [Sterolibacteriaceae bacterium MAG5]|nr:hypothetical protein [Candidatus Nitricoxidireducens bremensis]